MNTNKKLTLLIDDDSTCNSISKILLKRKFNFNSENEFEIISFNKPVEGLAFLKESLQQLKFQKILILLDINMPLMSGWEFLVEFEHYFPEMTLEQTEVKIYILTSSVSRVDIDKAKENSNVEDLISKPLTTEIIERLYNVMA
ncbi:MAG: response regulator [Ignavibacteria bacterium]|jgi:CheY-like chemotaxis protein|nr:response regulator [Ignavibacteria bacterium]